MAATPKYVQDLIAQAKVHTEQLANLRNETADLGEKAEIAKDEAAQLRSEVAVLKQQLADQIKKFEQWEHRSWGLLVLFVGALLSLASGLIVTVVTLTKR